jgi:hypothetical protein
MLRRSAHSRSVALPTFAVVVPHGFAPFEPSGHGGQFRGPPVESVRLPPGGRAPTDPITGWWEASIDSPADQDADVTVGASIVLAKRSYDPMDVDRVPRPSAEPRNPVVMLDVSAVALGALRRIEAVDPLIALASAKDVTDATRAIAIAALGLLGDPEPVRSITRLATDPGGAPTTDALSLALSLL